ncbi:hypothetical protein ACIPSA_30120 [Streptomyces sp. NPDC086549]|uniref:hypothetical protein n=1 Tax=Streptomyces sp. NPDC086549 TaxID=3365752 RepID=UPI003808D310
MAHRHPPEEVDQLKKAVSPCTDIALRDVAELILIRGRTGDMPPRIRAAPEDARPAAGQAHDRPDLAAGVDVRARLPSGGIRPPGVRHPGAVIGLMQT